MPRYGYHSTGLVFIKIGMWRSLRSLLLRDVPLFDDSSKPLDPECTPGERLVSVTMHMPFEQQAMAEDPDRDTDEERSRRRRILAAYVAEGSKLVEEEGLIDVVLGFPCQTPGPRGTWLTVRISCAKMPSGSACRSLAPGWVDTLLRSRAALPGQWFRRQSRVFEES